jgi:hypothetical protein
MNLVGVLEVEPEDFLEKKFTYPVYTQLKGADIYAHKVTGLYNRADFHENPSAYKSIFLPYTTETDVLMNGVYWDNAVPRLFEKEAIQEEHFKIKTIADITDDVNGSIPINLGDQSIEDLVYGVDRQTLTKTAPYLDNSIDIMAVGNLPNELPRDASRYFGEQLIKHIFNDLLQGNSPIVEDAMITKNGKLTIPYQYLQDWIS